MPLLGTRGSVAARSFGLFGQVQLPQPTVLISTNNALAVTSIVVNTPVGTVNGDMLVALITATTTRNAFSSAGWTEAFGSGAFTIGFARLTCLYRKLTAAPSANYTFSTNLSADVTVALLAVRPYTTYGGNVIKTFSTVASTTHTIPSSNLSTPALMVSGFGFDRSATAGMTATDPAGSTRAAYVTGGDTSVYRATLATYRVFPAVTTGSIVATTSQSVQSFAGYVLLTL